MNEIKKIPTNFIFPNFCFIKKYSNYVFMDSSILSTTEKAHNYFFEILGSFENSLGGKVEQPTWQLLTPFNYEGNYRDEKGNWGKWHINKELKEYTLDELQDYFLSFFNGYLRSHFILLADIFWINFSDKICVYACYNQEIIVIGFNVNCNLEKIKTKELSYTKINALQNNEMRFIDGQLQYTSEEKIKKVGDFFYKSFDEYINHWGPVLKYSKEQIYFLKCQFLKT